MRVATAFSRLLCLSGVWVRSVSFERDRVVVHVALRRKCLVCPQCSYSTRNRENLQHHDSVWRALDLGVWRIEIHARLRRLLCPEHGVLVEGVPFAREGARFTRDFEDLVAWLVTRTDKTATCRLVRIDWQTVGRIIERVGDELLDGDRLNELFEISIDEVAWRKGHRYLTLVGDHRRRCVVWGAEGKGQAAADRFFAELDPQVGDCDGSACGNVGNPDGCPSPVDVVHGASFPQARGVVPSAAEPAADGPTPVEEALEDAERWVGERAAKLTAISMDMTGGYAKSARRHAPQAVICIDNFHVVQLATKALDEVRREYWNQLRGAGEQDAAKRFKDARWALLKNPEDLTVRQTVTLTALHAIGGKVSRAWELKEMVRQFGLEEAVVFAGYQENIPEVMRAFDIFVMPSRQEAFGLVAIEAMAMECPILISSGGSSEEIVGSPGSGEFGLTVRPDDAFDLQNQLRFLIDHPIERVQMGQRGRQHVKANYDRQIRIQRTLNLYDRVLRIRGII